MTKMNWNKVRTENRATHEAHKVGTLLERKFRDKRIKQKRQYGWWTKLSDEWYVAIDSLYKIGPERIVQVRKASGEIKEYILGDTPEKTIDYEGGSYSVYKVRKV